MILKAKTESQAKDFWTFSQLDTNCLRLEIKGLWLFQGRVNIDALQNSLIKTLDFYPHLSWSECQVRKLATSHCTRSSISKVENNRCSADLFRDTHGHVYSHRLSYLKKCEKEATFFMANQV